MDGHSTCTRALRLAAAATAFLLVLPSSAVRAPSDASRVPRGGDAPSGIISAPMSLPSLRESYRLRAEADANRALKKGAALRLLASENIPSKWDSREHGWTTPVRNQRSYGTCWAFATLACLEAAYLKETNLAVTNIFSPNHLARHVGADFLSNFNTGGNDQIAAALLAAWTDPLLEEQDPYAHPGSTVDLPPVCHVHDIAWFPARTGPNDNDLLKKAVMKYGAAVVSYRHDGAFMNTSTGAYYYSGANDANHSVALVGWDDDYPVANFRSERPLPDGPGAFLVKNSHGAESYTNGYTWISYYDTSFVKIDFAAYPMPRETNTYGRVYQYDPCGAIANYDTREAGEDASSYIENWCANVFEADDCGEISAVGFYALAAGTEYVLRVYSGCATGPGTGTLACETSGTLDTAGFTTIDLPSPVPVATLEKFAVAIRLTTPAMQYPLAAEQAEDGYCTATAHAGESWYSRDGANWRDLRHFNETANFCVKAYTRYGSDGTPPVNPIASASPASDSVKLRAGETAQFSVSIAEGMESPVFAWTFNGVPMEESGASIVFTPTPAQHGHGVLACRATCGDAVGVRSWSVDVNATLLVSNDTEFQSALDYAIPDDVVSVAPGTYCLSVVAPSAKIEIVSEEGPLRTTIDAAGGQCYNGAFSPDTILSGFTLKSGYAEYGGGAESATLSNCVITACSASYGGGAYDSLLTDCVVSNCSASSYGGGLALSIATNCLVVCNFADESSGADSCVLSGCTLYGCDAERSHMTNTIVDAQASDFVDAANGDFRLSPRSRFIDAGDDDAALSERDLAGNARVFGPRVDLGCYERCEFPSGWAVPQVARGASAAEERASVAAALASSGVGGECAAHVATAAQYGALSAWAEGRGISAAELSDASVPLLSAALDADGLMDIGAEDFVVSGFSLGEDGSALMRVDVEGYDASRVDGRLLAAAVGAEWSETLRGTFAADGLEVEAVPGEDAVEMRVSPPEGADSSFFRAVAR